MKILKFLFGLPIRLLVGGIILLIVMAWGIGWGARAVLDRPAEQSLTTTMEATMEPTASPAVPLASTAQAPPADTPPTSTPAPSPTPSPTGLAEEIVQPGEGLYMVCRRHCPARWPPDDADLEAYARKVAELNSLPWPDSALSPGQSLRMPPCPE